jgi:hemerythrin-like domain-containing protein
MQARGPLMIEHRLIERMLAVIEDELRRIKSTNRVNSLYVDTVVDFIKVYADRTHHGKEEDILFEDLKKKPLSSEDREMMDELIKEHILGRLTTKALVQANDRYRSGIKTALKDVVEKLQALIAFYPKHIEKEDKVFFPSVRKYFDEREEKEMLLDFREFDAKMIHEKYSGVVERYEKTY